MNMINCSTDCAYQKDGYCCLDSISEINSSAVEGCHYYKKADTNEKGPPLSSKEGEVITNITGIF